MKQKILLLSVILFLILNSSVHGQEKEMPDNIVTACSVLPPAMEWSISYKRSTAMTYSPYQNAVVGDIDDDGIVEIIICADPKSPNTTANRNSNKIVIFKGNDISAPYKTITTVQPFNWSRYTKYAIGRTTIDGEDKVLLFVFERDNYLRAYDPNAVNSNIPVWTSSEVCHSSLATSTLTPTIADLNGDGIPEILIGTKVFSSREGRLYCKTSSELSDDLGISGVPIAEDIFFENRPRIIQGNLIYKPLLGLGGISLEKRIAASPHTSDPDYVNISIPDGGRASVVDMDLDGQPDLVISTISGNYTFIYIADPVTGAIKASKVIKQAASSSYPFVGDIDGDGTPEIVFIKSISGTVSTYKVFAYKYKVGNPVLQKFWELNHSDESGGTAMTLFDFNQDGIFEIVYRDESHIRIINGSLIHHQTGLPVSEPYNLAEFKCSSWTSTEYPVVADIDGDGQAEIIIVGGKDRADPEPWLGHLWVFKSGDPENFPWAPARSVWNQYAYNSLNVRKDLSIPSYPISPATVFPGTDKVLGTEHDVRPFNNFLQQQTLLDQHGNPLWLAPAAKFSQPVRFTYSEASDRMTISMAITNVGSAPFKSPFYVTVYKNNIGNPVKYTHAHTIGQNWIISFRIENFKRDWYPCALVVKINDSGDGLDDQVVCENDGTVFGYYTVTPGQQDVCRGSVSTITCDFDLPDGTNKYQWQSSPNDVSWTDIPGATERSYTPPDKKRGTNYYRVVVKDNTETVTSLSTRVKVNSCVIPVNHNISVMGYE